MLEADWLQRCAAAANAARWDEAEQTLAEALRALPGSAKLWFNQGVLHRQQGRQSDAIAAWRHALTLRPAHAETHLCLAAALLERQAHQAVAHAREAVRLAPLNLQAQLMQGRAEIADGEIEAAAAAFERALHLAPHNAEAELGSLYARLLRARGQLALPAQALTQLGAQLGTQLSALLPTPSAEVDADAGQYPESAPSLHPLTLYINYAIARQRLGDWRERPALFRALHTLLDLAARGDITELDSALGWEALALGLSEHQLQQITRLCCAKIRRIHAPQPLVPPRQRFARKRRIRIGYLSFNYGNHPTTYLIHRTLAAHDRTQFEVIAYGLNASDGSDARQRIEAAVDRYHDYSALTPRQVAQRIAADQIDILIGLGGHARGHVVDVALFRPAPVIVNYMAYMGTIGSQGGFDYHIADAIITPSTSQRWFDEALVHISPGNIAFDDALTIAPTPTRQAAGLPDDALVLCGFNNGYKIEPQTFSIWCQILHTLPQAVLWLYLTHPDQQHWLTQAAIGHGIAPQRLIFSPALPSAAHLARLSLADIYLDTFAYNGHTTLLDALYCGVPAVSLPGTHTVSRFGASALHAIGLSECIAMDASDYIACVQLLAGDPIERRRIRAHLIASRGTRLPFHVAARTAELEAAYRHMYERAAEGLAPEPFALPPEHTHRPTHTSAQKGKPRPQRTPNSGATAASTPAQQSSPKP